MVKRVNEEELREALAQGPVFVDFSAEWCGPCKMLAPVLAQVSEEYDGKLTFLNVDVDECPAIAQQLGIESIPTLVIFKDGKPASATVGFQPAANLKQFIEQAL